MDVKTELDAMQTLVESSLIRGGPFYRGQQAIRLIHPNKWNMGRRIAVAMIVGWLSLAVLTVVLNSGGLISLLRDYRVYSRMLIAVPVLLLGQAIMESRFRMLVSHFLDAGLITGSELRRQGIVEYGVLAQLHSMDFHEKWILSRAGQEAEFLTATECSSLADFGSAYEKLRELKPFRVDQEALIALALSVLIPIVPVILATIPLMVVLKTLLEALK